MLPPTTFGGPYYIEARSSVNGSMQTIALEDVMFGDVWICSGQSNMVFTVNMVNNCIYQWETPQIFHKCIPNFLICKCQSIIMIY